MIALLFALESLWSRIEDITHPTVQDYLIIEEYLDQRPFLEPLRTDPYGDRLNRILNFKLVSPDLTPPTSELYCFNDPNDRCIVLYASSNGIYPNKAKKLLSEIEASGYSGHVLLRIGGFPNTQFGGLKICHVPYAFKVAALQEAKLLGFKQILWLDLAIHPINDFETVFWEIEQTGTFFTTVGTLEDNRSTHLAPAAQALDITVDLYPQIPHISSSMIGLNMDNQKAIQLLDDWYHEVEKVYPCITWWPEELSLSVTAWRLELKPSTSFGDFVCAEQELHELEHRPNIQFYLDGLR